MMGSFQEISENMGGALWDKFPIEKFPVDVDVDTNIFRTRSKKNNNIQKYLQFVKTKKRNAKTLFLKHSLLGAIYILYLQFI